METPFVYGKLAGDKDFTNREAENKRLINNFRSGINTILISPRRWGKSSLVFKSAKDAAKGNKKIKFCFIDLYNVKSEQEFYQVLAREVIKATASKWEEKLEVSKNFLSRFFPKLTFSPDQNSEFSLGLDWQQVKSNPDEIINLAEKIATAKGVRIVVCIDEFQNIAEYTDPLAFQKKLRSNWQKHKYASYCLYGSRRHMMMEVFTTQAMPFYKFGDIVFLEKIKEQNWVDFIVHRFFETGKKIKPEDAALIAKLTECHPYYCQQLAQQVWLRSGKICKAGIVNEAHQSITDQLSLLFQSIADSLPQTQLNYLRAVIDGVEQFSSKETLQKYKLGTSANVLRIKAALINKDIIDSKGNGTEFLDPFFKFWLKKMYSIR